MKKLKMIIMDDNIPITKEWGTIKQLEKKFKEVKIKYK
jgi:hypothetical protein